MAIVRNNTAEGGTNGTAVTAANSGGASGDAFDIVNKPAGTTVAFTSTAFKGALAYNMGIETGGTTASSVLLRWGDTLNLAAGAFRFYVRFDAYPTVAVNLAALYTTGPTRAGTIIVNTAGMFCVQDAASTQVFTGSTAMPLNTWIRMELAIAPGTTTANGTLRAGWASGDAAMTEQFNSTTANTTTGAQVVRAQIGKLAGTWNGEPLLIDALAVGDTSTFLGVPPVGNPVAGAGTAQTNVEPYSVVTLSGTDSDSSSTITSRAWTQTGGTPAVTLSGASTATATFTAPGTIAGTTLTFQYQVTDAAAVSASATTTTAILPVTERAVIGGVEVPMQIRDN